MKYFYSCLIALLLWGTFSCKKDLGNYEYHPINEVKFKSLFASATINATYGKRFTLKPVLEYTDTTATDTSRYTYEWSYTNPTATGKVSVILSTYRNLDMMIGMTPNTYQAYYKVKDKETGVQFIQPFNLQVRNLINEGWLLMTEVNGTARLDMLSKEVDNSFTVIRNLLDSTSSGLKLSGKPKMVYAYSTGALLGPGINLPYGLYVGTDENTDRIDGDFFKWQPKYNVKNEIFGYTFPEKFHVDVIKKHDLSRAYMIANGDVMVYDRTLGVKYGVPVNYMNNASFKVAPYMACDEAGAGSFSPVFYDITNKRFVRHVGVETTVCTTLPNPSTNKLFDYNTIGMDMLWMNYTAPTAYRGIYCVMKNPTTSKLYLMRFQSTGTTQNYYAEILATDIDKAENFAISPTTGFLFYNVGGKVYKYDINTKATTLMLDKGAQKVSIVKFHSFQNTSKYTADVNRLIVCSYDPAKPEGENGTMEMFTVGTLDAPLTLDKTYTGFGKVAALTYRER